MNYQLSETVVAQIVAGTRVGPLLISFKPSFIELIFSRSVALAKIIQTHPFGT